jgi:hypothetical protein
MLARNLKLQQTGIWDAQATLEQTVGAARGANAHEQLARPLVWQSGASEGWMVSFFPFSSHQLTSAGVLALSSAGSGERQPGTSTGIPKWIKQCLATCPVRKSCASSGGRREARVDTILANLTSMIRLLSRSGRSDGETTASG